MGAPLKDRQVAFRRCDAVEDAEVLVVLRKTPDHQLRCVVGQRDAFACDGIHQLRRNRKGDLQLQLAIAALDMHDPVARHHVVGGLPCPAGFALAVGKDFV